MWIFGRPRSNRNVEPGAVYYREYGNHFREYADVVAVDSRLFGMPHVKFVKTYRNGDWQETGGTFMLALEAFLRAYTLSETAEEASSSAENAKKGVILDFQSARETWKAKQDRLRSYSPVFGTNAH